LTFQWPYNMVIFNYFKKLNIVAPVIEPGIISNVRVARINRLRKGGGLKLIFKYYCLKDLSFFLSGR